ncbi:EF-hand domain-containing protein [Roseofilum casamattae]|uniref:EF-hand domain-containing protein n=1 Tax=Roseofilum casamattae BLCC-M143 TaxID=3022442 RepID=A0ABT7C4L1_9CYAN|nr:EF-hand domain-containing protein [Roseofilum casamattae]MDJ1185678.1 EF-hand domain-containing protein [Roseofilum casamattae BLCC-M143]
MSLTPFQEKQWKRVFDIYDANGNGVIEKTDMEQKMAQIAQVSDLSSWEYDRVYNHLMNINWHYMESSADLNHDGQVTFDEWKDYIGALLSTPGGKGELAFVVDMAFELFDTNGNGFITLDEYKAFYQCLGLDANLAEGVFHYLDGTTTHDNRIDYNDFMGLVNQFIQGEDSGAPGNYLFGVD